MSGRPLARRQAGMTLIELIMFIVIVGVGVTGILSVMNTVVRSSADPMVRKQALAMADAVLEEVLAKSYADPDGAPNKEASRQLWDDVTDYHGETIAGTDLLPGAGSALLTGYTAAISVTATALLTGVAAYEITITVSGGPDTIVLRGYRTNY